MMKKFNTISIRSTDQIGSAIQRLRHLAGLSQVALAEKTGLTQAMISKIEKGLQKTQMNTLILILNALNVDLFIKYREKNKNPLDGLYE